MKIRITALICIAAMLVAMLAACGTDAAETTAEVTETTDAPTEPPTFFEEQGLTMWEGFEVTENPEVREVVGTREIPGGATLAFYEEGETVEKILHKELVDASVETHIAKYYSEEFTQRNIAHIVDSFYRADLAEDESLTKEAWLAEHEDYVIYNCWSLLDSITSEKIDEFLENSPEGEYNWWVQFNGVMILDQNSGEVFYQNDDRYGEIGKFSLTSGVEFAVVYNGTGYSYDSEISDNRDVKAINDTYVLAPKDYDGLAFMQGAYVDFMEDEDLLDDINDVVEEEDAAWEQKSYQEYIEDRDYKEYYFIPAAAAETDVQDTRPAPTTGTFFDKMGIDSNMEKFKIWENVSDSGVKETVWYNSIAIPGAEIQYYNANKRSAQSYVDKKLSDCMIKVQAREYRADQFAIEDIQDVINSFYEAEGIDITKEQWLQEHQNHKLVHFFSDTEFWVSNATNQFFANHNGYHWWWVSTNWNKLIDKYTGEVFVPQSGSDGVVETFTVNNIEFSVINTQSKYEWQESATGYKNLTEWYDMYVLMPADYDGLTFAMVLYEKTRLDEEILALYNDSESTQSSEETEENPSTWWSGDFYEEESYLKRYYFALEK